MTNVSASVSDETAQLIPKANGNGQHTSAPSNEESNTLNGTQQKPSATSTKSKPTLMQILWAPGVSTSIPEHLSIAALRIALTAFCLGTLFGLAVPRASEMIKSAYMLLARYAQPSVSSAADATSTSLRYAITRPQLHFYLMAWSVFHLLEFLITARYNATRLYSDSFLISNGLSYHLAHMLGLIEFLMTTTFFQTRKTVQPLTLLGVSMMLFGQTIRSLAMVHAAGNFSHEVAIRKRQDHQLVTDGVYAIFRHPSYVGFFYWALGTQIMLANPISTTVFAVVLWRFFRHRIENEEIYLIHFFGQPYRDFKANTRTWIPFIP